MDRKIEVTENALWTRRGKTIAAKNLKRRRKSPSLASVIYELDRCVVEYDYFYVRPELDEQENEVEECHKALIEALAKPERKLVLRIIDAQNLIIEQTSLDSFTVGFELAWRLSIELQNDENERSFSCRTRRTGARCVWEDEI